MTVMDFTPTHQVLCDTYQKICRVSPHSSPYANKKPAEGSVIL